MFADGPAPASEASPAAGEAGPRGQTPQAVRRVLVTAWNLVTAAVGAIMGLLPHLVHHVGLLGGAVFVTGATGNVLFAVVGLVLSLPVLRRLHRRFHTWKAPALAVAVFALMFSISAFVIGPAISGDPGQDPGPVPVRTPAPGEHDTHHP